MQACWHAESQRARQAKSGSSHTPSHTHFEPSHFPLPRGGWWIIWFVPPFASLFETEDCACLFDFNGKLQASTCSVTWLPCGLRYTYQRSLVYWHGHQRHRYVPALVLAQLLSCGRMCTLITRWDPYEITPAYHMKLFRYCSRTLDVG